MRMTAAMRGSTIVNRQFKFVALLTVLASLACSPSDSGQDPLRDSSTDESGSTNDSRAKAQTQTAQTVDFALSNPNSSRVILGSFSTGDLNNDFRGWGASWYRTTDSQLIYTLDGKVYQWRQQRDPRDPRHEIQLPDLISRGPGSKSTRRSIAATLEAIYRYFTPVATAPYARFNSLYLNGLSAERLNEIWLQTRRGWLYFVYEANESMPATAIYKWNGRSHDRSSLIARIPLYRNGTFLLPYIALNPTRLPNIIIGNDIMMGRQLTGKLRYTAHYFPVFQNYVNYGGKLMQSRPRRLYGDWLDPVVFENPPENSERFFSSDIERPYIVTLVDQNMNANNFAAALEPDFLHIYSDEKRVIRPKTKIYPQLVAHNPSIVHESVYLYGSEVDPRSILSVTNQAGTNTTIELAVGNLRWTTGLVAIERVSAQTGPGTVEFTSNQIDGQITLNASNWQSFKTNGWKTPIEAIYFGNAKCLSFKEVLMDHRMESASKTIRTRSPESFRCFFVDVPTLSISFRTPITVILRGGRRISLGSHRVRFEADTFVNTIHTWQKAETCEQACRYSGGKLDLSEAEEEALCQSRHNGWDQTYSGRFNHSGSLGCRYSYSSLTGGRNMQFNYAYYGQGRADTAAIGKVCFCRYRSSFYNTSWKNLLRPLGVAE